MHNFVWFWSLSHLMLFHLFRLRHKIAEQAEQVIWAATKQMWDGRTRESKKVAKKSLPDVRWGGFLEGEKVAKNTSPRCETGGSEKINSGHTNIWHLVIVDVRFVKFSDLKRHSLIITTSLKPTRSLQFCCRNSGSVVTIFTGLSLESQSNKLSFKVSQVWWETESKCLPKLINLANAICF